MKTNTMKAGVTVTDLTAEQEKGFTMTGATGAKLDVNPESASYSYMALMAKRLDSVMNSVEVKTMMGDEAHIRFHRDTDAPTPVIVPSLASRSLMVNMKNPYGNNTMPTKATMRQGSTIVSNPAVDAMMLSLVLDRLDMQAEGAITELTLQQEVKAVMEQIDQEVIGKLFKYLVEDTKGNSQYMTTKEWNVPAAISYADRAEKLEDMIDFALQSGRALGNSIEDFSIGLSGQANRDAQRMARKAGAKSVDEFFGTDTFAYVSETTSAASGEYGVILIPKRHCVMSLRERADGTVFDFKVTRRPDTQSTTLEVNAVMDLLIDGQTTVKTNAGASVAVALPLIQRHVFKTTSA